MISGFHPPDLPRERLARKGPDALSDTEILALLINNGMVGRSAIDIAKDLLSRFPKLTDLAARDVSELKTVSGMGTAKASTLCAAFELARRIQAAPFDVGGIVASPQTVARLMAPKLRHLRYESFHVLLMSTANHIMRDVVVSEGSLNSVVIHPREVFRLAIAENAAGIILVHNHPSGNIQPSKEDIVITKQLVEAGKIVGIKVLDHLIIGGDDYTSLAERNLV